MRISPCYYCKKHCEGCHVGCERSAAWDKENAERSALIRKNREAEHSSARVNIDSCNRSGRNKSRRI